MKLRAALIFSTILAAVSVTPAFAAHSKKVAFKLSVLLPDHVTSADSETGRRSTRIIRAPQDQVTVEQVYRNDERMILKTAVVK